MANGSAVVNGRQPSVTATVILSLSQSRIRIRIRSRSRSRIRTAFAPPLHEMRFSCMVVSHVDSGGALTQKSPALFRQEVPLTHLVG